MTDIVVTTAAETVQAVLHRFGGALERGDAAAALAPALAARLDSVGWLTRLASANFLQRLGRLSSTQLYGLWNDAPLALRADLAVLLGRTEQTSDVARALHVEADEVERALADFSA